MLMITAPPIQDQASLIQALQSALRLEHSTIPPYLTALMTLTGQSPSAEYGRQLIRDIVLEEMLHMNLVCNMINALGGQPELNRPDFMPVYPGPLPLGVAGGIEVPLKRYSRALVRDVFMEIEEPETPLQIPTRFFVASLVATAPKTIGAFYGEIRDEVIRQGDGAFTGDPARQVRLGLFGADEEIAVSDVASCVAAIDLIVQQGEGTSTLPSDQQGDVAHYYRFQELAKGMKLVADPTFVFDASQPIQIDDQADVIQMADNPQLIAIDPADTEVAGLSDECDRLYSSMLNRLHEGFNGAPETVGLAVGLMFQFRGTASSLLEARLEHGPQAGAIPGPRFLYTGPDA